ncbi:hypothetical protein ACFWMT_17080 [Streptomyces sp. NPDC058368]
MVGLDHGLGEGGKERDLLAEVFPNRMVEEHYVVSLAVTTC